MYYFPNIDERTGVEFITAGVLAHGEPVQHDGFAVYQSLTLEGGAQLRNVKVDSRIDPFFLRSFGDPNAIYVVKKLLSGWVVYAIESEGRLITGSLDSFVRSRYIAAALISGMAAMMPIVTAFGGDLGIPMLIGVAGASLVCVNHFSQLCDLLRSASRLRGTRSLDIA